jgi:hypothetical protein
VSMHSRPGPGWRRAGSIGGKVDGEERFRVIGSQMELEDGALQPSSTRVVTRGLPGYAHCFTSVS